MKEFVRSDATHLLSCRHCLGKNITNYEMRCIPLKAMPDGRLKILVFGDLFWGGENKKIRYVSANRVMEITKANPHTGR